MQALNATGREGTRIRMSENYRAIIFDFNGVISNDEPLHLELLRRMLIEEKMTFTERDYFEKYLGCDDYRCFQRALVDHGRASEAADGEYLESLIRRKTGYYHEAIHSRDLLFPGIAGLIRELSQDYPLAIASGALRGEIEVALDQAELRHLFAIIVAAEDVRESKPAPEGYLRALTGLRSSRPELENLPASQCLVIEDSVAGVTAAKRAGMQCLAVTTSYPAASLTQADWIVAQVQDWFRRP